MSRSLLEACSEILYDSFVTKTVFEACEKANNWGSFPNISDNDSVVRCNE